MSAHRLVAVAGANTRLLLADPAPFVILTLMPLLLMAFLEGTSGAALVAGGHAGASGAEHVVPGMTALFGIFGATLVAAPLFQEHGWGTWDRLRASGAGSVELLVGKVAPAATAVVAQMVLLVGVGALLFGLRPAGPWAAVLVVTLATGTFVVGLGLAAAAVFRSFTQLNAAVNVAAMALGGIGGALAPVETLPGWAQAIAPLSPVWWSLEGYRAVLLDGGGPGAVAGPVAVLVAVTAGLVGIAAWRFRLADDKVFDG